MALVIPTAGEAELLRRANMTAAERTAERERLADRENPMSWDNSKEGAAQVAALVAGGLLDPAPIPPPPYCVTRDQARFRPRSWESYDWTDLYWWVKLLCKRAGNRLEPDGTDKDLADAHNYLEMARAKLAHLKAKPKPTVDDLLDAETGEQHLASMTAILETAMTTHNRVASGWEK